MSEHEFDTSVLPALAGDLIEHGWTVFEPRDDAVAYVPCSMQLVAELAAKDSQPLVIVSVQPGDVEGSHELLLRRPSRAELEAAMRRFRG